MLRRLRHRFIGEILEDTTSFHKKSQVILLFNIAFVVGFTGFTVTILGLLLGTYPMLIASIGNMIFATIALLIMRTGKMKLAGTLYFIILFFLLFGSLIFNKGVMHFGSPFWIMLLNILVLYILGLRWGVVFLTASGLVFTYYLVFVLPESLEIVSSLPPKIYYSVVYETAIALFLLAYIIAAILKASRESDKLLSSQNHALIKSNEEKTVMLMEIHHRVKNNLQVIISLMRLKMIELNDSEAVVQYQDTIDRVMAMAKIHEKMYRADDISNIDLKKYFEELAGELISTYATDKEVAFKQEVNTNAIGLDLIVPLALMFNELFTNSLEHAFDNTDQPEIKLSIKHLDDDMVEFIYADNGVWKPNANNSSLGTELIQSLSEQLNSNLEFGQNPTRYSFRFKIR